MAGILDDFMSGTAANTLMMPVVEAGAKARDAVGDWWEGLKEPTMVQKDQRGNEYMYGSKPDEIVDGFTGADNKVKRKEVTPVKPSDTLTPDGELVKQDLTKDLKGAAEASAQKQEEEAKPSYATPVKLDPKLESLSTSKGGYVEGDMPEAEVSDPQGYHTADEYRSKYNTSKGRQDADFQNTNLEWWEDRAFYQGLMRWGMGVLGGEDYGTAFDNATSIYESEKSRDQREQWAEEMSDEYSPRSIQKWLETGNEADLESYESMADEENRRMLDREQLASRMSVEDTKKLQQLQLQNQILENKNLNRQWEWDKEDRKYSTRKAYWDAERAKFQAQKAQNQATGGGTGTTKQTELTAKTGLYGDIMNTVDLKTANLVPTVGEDVRSLITTAAFGDSAAGRRIGDQFKSDQQVQIERNRQSFIQGPLRIATGSAYGSQEMADWENILFPQTNNPEEIRRKMLAQAVVMSQFNKINSGGTKETIPKEAVSGVASGQYEARVDPNSGSIIGIIDNNTGKVIYPK